MPQKQVYEEPDTEAIIDNIGKFPFYMKVSWKGGKLSIVVEQPQAGNPYPIKEFEMNLLDVSDNDEGDEA